MERKTNCDDCVHFDYNDDSEQYECTVSLDEDEYEKYASGRYRECPYYKPYDEYKTVRKQN